MFPAECVDKEKGLGELSRFDQETRAINFPCGGCFFHVHLPFGGRENEKAFRNATADFDFCSLQLSLFAGGIFICCWLNVVKDEDESTRPKGGGQLPKIGAVEEKSLADFLG